MKKLFVALYVFFLVVSLVCPGCKMSPGRPQNSPPKISKIKIIDKTYLNYLKHGQTVSEKTITDPGQVKDFQVELDSMKQVQNLNIRHNFGFYDITIYFKDGGHENAGLIYTVYDGVVFYNYDLNRSFKNNDMETIVRSYFN